MIRMNEKWLLLINISIYFYIYQMFTIGKKGEFTFDGWYLSLIFGILMGLTQMFTAVMCQKRKKIKPDPKLAKYSNDQLREMYYGHKFWLPDGFGPGIVIWELKVRGEDISEFMPQLLDMMLSTNPAYNELAIGAFRECYPEYYEEVKDISFRGEPERWREKVAELRERIQVLG